MLTLCWVVLGPGCTSVTGSKMSLILLCGGAVLWSEGAEWHPWPPLTRYQ